LFRVPADVPTSAKGLQALIETTRGTERELDLGDYWAALHFAMTGELPIPREEAERGGVVRELSRERLVRWAGVAGKGPRWILAAARGCSRLLPASKAKQLTVLLDACSRADFVEGFEIQDLNDEQTS
jgi:hypothetical protein